MCFQSDSYALNDTQLSTIPLDEFALERETQFQEPPAAGAGRQDQGWSRMKANSHDTVHSVHLDSSLTQVDKSFLSK